MDGTPYGFALDFRESLKLELGSPRPCTVRVYRGRTSEANTWESTSVTATWIPIHGGDPGAVKLMVNDRALLGENADVRNFICPVAQ